MTFTFLNYYTILNISMKINQKPKIQYSSFGVQVLRKSLFYGILHGLVHVLVLECSAAQDELILSDIVSLKDGIKIPNLLF